MQTITTIGLNIAKSVFQVRGVDADQRDGRSSLPGDGVASLRLDVGCPDHLGPFLGFCGYKMAEISGRSGKWFTAEVGEPRLYLGIGKTCIDLLVELAHDLDGRFHRSADAKPLAGFISRHELAHGWEVRQHF